MAYNITLTNGTGLVTVADGSTDTSYTSLTLIGKNFAGYGQFVNENYVKLLENFANQTPPENALEGQIWWDTVTRSLKVRSINNTWKTVSSSTSSNAAPINATQGDMWWDIANGQLKVWSGASWVVIGPSYTPATGQTGASADIVTEVGVGTAHIVVKFFVNNTIVAVLSKDPSFTVSNLAGFNTINPGFNLSSTGNLGYFGNANNALNLAGVSAANYLRGDQLSTTLFPLVVQNDAGLLVGAGNDFSTRITPTAANLMGMTAGKDLSFYVNVSGVQTKLLTLNGTNGAIEVTSSPSTALGIATKQYVDTTVSGSSSLLLRRDGANTIAGNIVPSSNSLYSIGSASANLYAVYATNFVGTASNSAQLGGVPAGSFVRSDQSSSTNYPIAIHNDSGMTIGVDGDFVIDVTSVPNSVNLKSTTLNKSVIMSVNVAGATTNAFTVDGLTGLATVSGAPTADLGIATKKWVEDSMAISGAGFLSVASDINPDGHLTRNIGTNSVQWNSVHAGTFYGNLSGNALTANYADLAERFEADAAYMPGTVVELGGAAEITAAVDDLSDNVFGVISTKAAYLMNAAAGTDHTHPPVAMQGRVPVRVVGTVKKGDRLVSAGNGLARAAAAGEVTPFNVIGRALKDKATVEEGTVEAIVKLNS